MACGDPTNFNSVCPHCGHCQACGRGPAPYTMPYYRPYTVPVPYVTPYWGSPYTNLYPNSLPGVSLASVWIVPPSNEPLADTVTITTTTGGSPVTASSGPMRPQTPITFSASATASLS